MLNLIGNILWLLLAGIWDFIAWILAGIIWCCTIIGIPFGLKCFGIAGFALWPMGRDIEFGSSTTSIIINIIWLLFFGWELAIGYFIQGILLCCTIIGIPFGLQCFKLGKLALLPFGATIVDIPQA